MNKLKSYTEYIILAAVAVLLLLYIIFRSAGNINYVLPEPAAVDFENISRITVEGPMKGLADLEFSKTEDQWFIEPEGWQAENSNLVAIAKALGDLKVTDLISTSGNPGVYALDEQQRVLVKAWEGDDLIREVWVGKVSNNGIYTYMMFPGNENIYSVRGNLPSRVKDKNSMRDKRFLQIARDSVQKMTLTSTDSLEPVVLTKDLTTIWGSESFEADDAAVKAVVNMFDPLRCKDFLYEQPSGSPAWNIEILTAEGAVNLELWPKTADDIYPARCSQNGYLVQTTSYAVEKILGALGIVFEEE
ncbi:MAG TPA: hypothetical protein DCO79_03520 [Spirochaeta sp.]|nr:hypothetical protein [Spirochaeta sp.]